MDKALVVLGQKKKMSNFSFFRYPGGKSQLSGTILQRLLPHITSKIKEYREPFFGGGSVGLSLLHSLSRNETYTLFGYGLDRVWLNDKDIALADLWRQVVYNPEGLKEKIKEFVPSIESFYRYKNCLSELDRQSYMQAKYSSCFDARYADIAFMKLAIHQMSYSGLGVKSGAPLGGKNQESQYKIDCRWSPKNLCQKVDKIHKLFSLNNVTIRNGDFMDMIQRDDYDSGKALLYLDPPYYVKGNDLYQFGFNEEDHIRLAKALKETSHEWVLSYDDCPEIRELYSWAPNKHEIHVTYNITATKDKETGERKSRSKKELLIYS